jgi:hypothetical protein
VMVVLVNRACSIESRDALSTLGVVLLVGVAADSRIVI